MKKSILALGTILFLSSPAFAFTQTSPMQATATVLKTCSIQVTDFHFGDVGSVLQEVTIPGKITTLCSKGVSASFTVVDSDYQLGTTRKMIGDKYKQKLGYNLTDKNGYVLIQNTFWSGTTLNSSMPIGGTGQKVETQLNAQIITNQYNRYIREDNYSDTVLATLTF
jgi:hypothetical protein